MTDIMIGDLPWVNFFEELTCIQDELRSAYGDNLLSLTISVGDFRHDAMTFCIAWKPANDQPIKGKAFSITSDQMALLDMQLADLVMMELLPINTPRINVAIDR